MSVQTTYTTAPAAAYAGLLADDTENDIMTLENGGTPSIPFGAPVSFKTGSTSDKSAQLIAATTDKIAGILVHSHDYQRTFTLPDGTVEGELDSTGLVTGTEMAVLWRGTIWVKVFDAVAVGDAVYFAVDSGGSHYTGAGQIGKTSDAGHAVQVTNAFWVSSSAAGGFAKLRLAALVA